MTIDAPGAVGFTEARGINSGSKIVGNYADASGSRHGFILHDGVFTDVNGPQVQETLIAGINDQDQIVGSMVRSITVNGFVRLPSFPQILIPIPFRPSPKTYVNGLSGHPKIVGAYFDGKNCLRCTVFHGVLLSNGRRTNIDHPGALSTYPLSVNDNGQVVGAYANAIESHAFLWHEGVFTTVDVDVPGARTTAQGINDAGQIVGEYADDTGAHGFILDRGALITIDVPGASLTQINGISATGDIVGSVLDTNGTHGFVGWKQ